ncbi:MAG TPA: hypothetical protein VG735_06515 [Caulobacterales bacterium]|nr:hypothetical protein [Caulobacterales bacterium]
MATEAQTVLKDIAFVKALVERGGKSDAKGGGLLIGVGSLCGTASLFHWCVQNNLLALPMESVRLGWIAAVVLSVILAAALNARTPLRTAPDNIYSAARLGVLMAIATLWLVLGLAAWRFHNPNIMELAVPTVFALGGGFWVVFSSVQERKQLRWVPVGDFAAAIGLAFMLGSQHLYLANALALFALFVVPGIVLRRRYALTRD